MQAAIIIAALVSILPASAQDCCDDPLDCAKQRADQQSYSIRWSWRDSNGTTWTPMGRWNVYGSNGQVCTKMGKTTYCKRR